MKKDCEWDVIYADFCDDMDDMDDKIENLEQKLFIIVMIKK